MKRYLSTIAFCMLCLCANAQSFQFGVKAGINISGETDHVYPAYTSTGSKSRTGVALGGVINCLLTDRMDIEADLLYSMQGMKDVITIIDDAGAETDGDYKLTSHYVNIPVAFKYYLMDGLYIEAGPQVGFLLSKDEPINLGGICDASNTKKIDYGVLGGIGMVFSNNLFLDARYVHGFSDTSKLYEGGKNRTFQIVVGYYF